MSTVRCGERYRLPDGIRFYEIHRWLNPFRTEQAMQWTPFTPAEIERELRPFMFRQARRSDPGPIFHGEFGPDGFQIRRWRTATGRIPPVSVGTLSVRYEPATNGTTLHLSLGMSSRRAMAFLGFACLHALLIVIYVLSLSSSNATLDIVVALAWILTGAVWLVCLVTVQWLDRNEVIWYLELLSFVLMASKRGLASSSHGLRDRSTGLEHDPM